MVCTLTFWGTHIYLFIIFLKYNPHSISQWTWTSHRCLFPFWYSDCHNFASFLLSSLPPSLSSFAGSLSKISFEANMLLISSSRLWPALVFLAWRYGISSFPRSPGFFKWWMLSGTNVWALLVQIRLSTRELRRGALSTSRPLVRDPENEFTLICPI